MKTYGKLAALALLSLTAPVAGEEGATPDEAETVRGSTIAIEVQENPDVAMFFFAYHAARQLSGESRDGIVALSPEDAKALSCLSEEFEPVANAFTPHLDKDLVFDRDMFLAGVAINLDPSEFPDADLLAALRQFRPHYDAHLAPRHGDRTGKLAAQLKAQIASHGDAIARAISRELEADWRPEPIRIVISPYASWAGAFTNKYQTVISTREDYFNHALEMAFHEAAHTSPMDDRLKELARDAMAKHGIENRRFWHYLQFYAVGQAAREVLGEDYVPYYMATGLREGSGKPFYEAMEQVWDKYDTLPERVDATAAMVAGHAH